MQSFRRFAYFLTGRAVVPCGGQGPSDPNIRLSNAVKQRVRCRTTGTSGMTISRCVWTSFTLCI